LFWNYTFGTDLKSPPTMISSADPTVTLSWNFNDAAVVWSGVAKDGIATRNGLSPGRSRIICFRDSAVSIASG
jgi:hypothetical protein